MKNVLKLRPGDKCPGHEDGVCEKHPKDGESYFGTLVLGYRTHNPGKDETNHLVCSVRGVVPGTEQSLGRLVHFHLTDPTVGQDRTIFPDGGNPAIAKEHQFLRDKGHFNGEVIPEEGLRLVARPTRRPERIAFEPPDQKQENRPTNGRRRVEGNLELVGRPLGVRGDARKKGVRLRGDYS